ncbi:Bug family tripartite tricarboxylate transporter substrate binding protein [Hydrogenophaga sp.]|uniref:Bug family tripartite tricarboxylate transporter substrate binding protein n=1 Tax=Hydrogenophaga sp. TaxID=1904254 RepID=UPI002FCC48B6
MPLCSMRLPRRALLALISAVAVAFALPAQAAYPDRPIRLIVPFPAGGTVDFVARLVATQLGQQLATPVVVENVPGAGGTLATARVAKSAADGYTLLFTTPNHTINPALITRLPFDTEKDLAPVSLVAEIPELLVAHGSQPFNTFAEFVAYAKANPGKLDYASAGNGTLPHITMELLLQRLGLQVNHVAYRGAAPALNDLLGGVVAVKMDTIATASQHLKGGRIKPLAIASLRRSPLMPEVPTVAESGVPGYLGILWMGILAPAGTDPALISTLHKAITGLARAPAFQQQLKVDGVDLVASDPQTFAKLIRTELTQWAEVVRKSQIKAD